MILALTASCGCSAFNPWTMPQPNWTSIFTLRPELDPPGYAETVIDMIENPKERRPRGKGSGKGKDARWPSLKHGAE